jgi:hypothetical protein
MVLGPFEILTDLVLDPLLLFAFALAIALIAVARPSPSLPLLLQPSPLPSLSHSTTIANAIVLFVALALFVNRHPHCRHHRPCHPHALCCCRHNPRHALEVHRRPLSWSCDCLVNALSPATALLLPSLVDCCRYTMLPTSRDPPAGGVRGTYRRAHQISFIVR